MDSSESSFKCKICNMTYLKENEYKSHKLFYHSKYCPFCKTNISKPECMIPHLQQLHPRELNNGDVKFDMVNCTPIDQCADKQATNIKSSREIVKDVYNIPQSMFKNQHNSSNSNRSSLMLDLFAGKEQIFIHCLLCSYTNENADNVQEHMNKQHFDLTSPSMIKSESENNKNSNQCPLCCKIFDNENKLELHVNDKHKDIISPLTEDKQSEELLKENNVKQLCPVCNVAVFDSSEKLASHLEKHYIKKGISPISPDTSSDHFLAKELQQKYKETLKQVEEKEFEQLQAQYGMDNNGNFNEQSITNMQQAVYEGELSVSDFYEKRVKLKITEKIGVDDGNSCIKDIMPYVIGKSKSSSNVAKVYACADVDYYLGSYGDKGWGCGFRNLQMLLSSLMHHNIYYEQLCQLWKIKSNKELPSSRMSMPSLSRLQQAIEWAWNEGFDVQGQEQLGGQVYNTRKWIGATEIVALLSALGIQCQLVDFHAIGKNELHHKLMDWVLNYFKKKDIRFPLYLQHQGHSRTIIGIEQLRKGNNLLLILDPGNRQSLMHQIKSMPYSDKPMSIFRTSIHSLKNKEYQIVSVTGIIKSQSEYQDSKVIKSIKIH